MYRIIFLLLFKKIYPYYKTVSFFRAKLVFLVPSSGPGT